MNLPVLILKVNRWTATGLWLWALFALLFIAFTTFANPLESKGPKFVLALTLNEFSILNVSEMDGLLKYGGSGEFKLNMAREGTNEVVWTVTIDSPRLLELLGIFVGEKTMKLVQSLDPNNLDANQKLALQAVKSLTQKMEQAQKNPVWDLVTFVGYVMQEKEDWKIVSKDGLAKITGNRLEELKKLEGKAVVASGFIKVRDQFEVTGFLEKRKETLEVFVMSYCPFGQRAETALYNLLEQTNALPKPVVEVRYIFYKQKKDGQEVFASLHGDEELTENLVQMVLRDRFPNFCKPYIRLRASSGHLPWSKLAEQAGLPKENLAEIEKILATEREALLQKEYDYATVRYGITDGSPSYVWESERVTDLQKIGAFKGLGSATQETCAQ